MASREFRSDLYYRLNVFPLTVPALRDRRKDIPLLVRYFTQKRARRVNKTIDSISTEGMATLSHYDWPGNVCELEISLDGPSSSRKDPSYTSPLQSCNRSCASPQAAKWLIGGRTGAAAKLGMKRTTFQSTLQKHGISRPQ